MRFGVSLGLRLKTLLQRRSDETKGIAVTLVENEAERRANKEASETVTVPMAARIWQCEGS